MIYCIKCHQRIRRKKRGVLNKYGWWHWECFHAHPFFGASTMISKHDKLHMMRLQLRDVIIKMHNLAESLGRLVYIYKYNTRSSPFIYGWNRLIYYSAIESAYTLDSKPIWRDRTTNNYIPTDYNVWLMKNFCDTYNQQ